MSSKTFTQPADRELLCTMYDKTFRNVMGGIEHLWLGGLGWRDAEIQELVQILPWCVKLKDLELYGNEITSNGANAIAKVLTRCQALERLDLDGNKIDEDDTDLLFAWI